MQTNRLNRLSQRRKKPRTIFGIYQFYAIWLSIVFGGNDFKVGKNGFFRIEWNYWKSLAYNYGRNFEHFGSQYFTYFFFVPVFSCCRWRIWIMNQINKLYISVVIWMAWSRQKMENHRDVNTEGEREREEMLWILNVEKVPYSTSLTNTIASEPNVNSNTHESLCITFYFRT